MSKWTDILSDFSPTWQGDQLVSLTQANAPQNNGKFIPLTGYRFIRVEGPDAEKFLQGQCTCDFRELNNGQFVLGAHCTHQGRMISSFTGVKISSDQIVLRVHASIAENALASLKKYIVFSKAEATLDDERLGLALQGDASAIDFQLPENNGDFTIDNGIATLKAGTDLYEIWAHPDEIARIISSHKADYVIAPSSDWALSLIDRGVAEIRDGIAEAFIPQMLNYDRLNAVSFKKGCYTGQEIVARMHYKGKTKKNLHHFSYKADTETPTVGEEVIDIESNKTIGQIVLAGQMDGEHRVLAVLNENAHKLDELRIGNCDVKIIWLELPYAIN